MNATRYNNNYYYGRDCNRSRGHGHGRRQFNYGNYNGHNSSNSYKPSHNKEKQERGKNIYIRDTKKVDNACYWCGMKGKEKNIEIIFFYPHQGNNDIYSLDMTHLDIADFFEQTDKKVNNSCNDNN